MALFRVEFDLQEGTRTEIAQLAYRNSDGHVLVLDAGAAPPDGYAPFDPDGPPAT